MKKTFILGVLILMCQSILAQIDTSGNWYSGQLIFSARNIGNGQVLMNGMAEGEEIEFVLAPVAGKPDTFQVKDSPNGYVNMYESAKTVKHLQEGNLDVLCFYNEKNLLEDVLSKETEDDSEVLNRTRWIQQMKGYYVIEFDGEVYNLEWEDNVLNIGGILVPYEAETFNGNPTGYINVEETGGTFLMGLWQVEPTLEGFRLHEVEYDDMDFTSLFDRKKGELFYEFWYNDEDTDRFAYASLILLNDKQFREFDKPTLRIMRNSILAHNGYVFSSADLKEYFGNQAWYRPAASNDEVYPKLSLIERLNIELIQAMEGR